MNEETEFQEEELSFSAQVELALQRDELGELPIDSIISNYVN